MNKWKEKEREKETKDHGKKNCVSVIGHILLTDNAFWLGYMSLSYIFIFGRKYLNAACLQIFFVPANKKKSIFAKKKKKIK